MCIHLEKPKSPLNRTLGNPIAYDSEVSIDNHNIIERTENNGKTVVCVVVFFWGVPSFSAIVSSRNKTHGVLLDFRGDDKPYADPV